jgi:hypothetical protein
LSKRFFWAAGISVPVLVLVACALLGSLSQPRGLIRMIPLPSWISEITQRPEGEHVFYAVHAIAGTVLTRVGAPPSASASEWFKAAWHAQTSSEMQQAEEGLARVAARGQPEQLQAVLCPYVSGWSDATQWGARGRQLLALRSANLSCIDDDAGFFGSVPDGVPIQYTSNPPDSGLWSASLLSTFGVSPVAVVPAVWVHNLAFGEVVLLYHCPAGCTDTLAAADELFKQLPPGQNAHGGPARFHVIAYDDMDSPLAVVAWAQSLPLNEFDPASIEQFYVDHVDRGIECRDLICY